VIDDEPRRAERLIDSGHESVDRVTGEAEEVEVARASLDVAAGDQCGSAGEREILCFLQAGDDRRNLLLQGAQHLCVAAMKPEPLGPRLSH